MALSPSFHRVGFAALLVLFLAVPALATLFSAQEIVGLSGVRFRGMGMNNNGDVVGVYYDASTSRTRGFLYSGGSLQQLGTLNNWGMNYDYEMAINDSGHIVGKMAQGYTNDFYPVMWSSPSSYAFLTVPAVTGESAATSINNSNQVGLRAIVNNYDSSILTPAFGSTIIEPAGHKNSSVLGIADSGDFVGQASNIVTGLTRGVVGRVNASGGLVSLTTFDAFTSSESTYASAINNAGQCVGYGDAIVGPNLQYKAFLRDADGTIHDLGVGTGILSYATSVNNKGYVVGVTVDGNSVLTDVLFSQTGSPQSLVSMTHGVPAGLTMYEPRGINNNGQILVTAKDSGGAYHTLLLTPDPLQKNFTTLGDLGAWQAHLPDDSAAATVAPDPDNPSRYVCKLLTGSPVSISQQTATPANAFSLTFDYKAQAAVGTLSATINGTQVGSLDLSGAAAGQWQTASFPVADSSLSGLLDATVAIGYDAAAGSAIYLDNIALTQLPEPLSVTLLGLGGLAMLRRRR